jgi:thiol:disulfide interchange protein DsbD
MVVRSGSALFGFALFFTLAIGMGLPYIGLAVAAGSIRRLPRSGEWLRWTEEFFGFVLIGLAIYFLEPVVRPLEALLPFYAAGAGIYLGFITPAGRSWQPFWVFRMMAGTLAVAGLIYLVVPKPNRERLRFQPFDQDRLALAREQRQPALVDFSAAWCIRCREMEKTTFADPEVIKAASRFVRLKADLTSGNLDTDLLARQFAVQGVPTTLFINSSGKISKREVGYVDSDHFLNDLRTVD